MTVADSGRQMLATPGLITELQTHSSRIQSIDPAGRLLVDVAAKIHC